MESAGERKGCILGVRTRFVRGFIFTYDSSEPLAELDAPSGSGEPLLSRGGVGGWTTKTVGGDIAVDSAETTRWIVAGGDEGALELAEPVAMMTEREQEGLRGIRGRGAPARLECREYEYSISVE